MKTPICAFDAKSGVLCLKCEARLKSGHLTETDVEMSVALAKLSETQQNLDRITLLKALEVDGDYVLILKAGDLGELRKKPEVIEKVESSVRRKVWLVEGEVSDRKLLEDLFYPARILTVNVVWLPDGSKLTKAIVPARTLERLPVRVDKIKRIMKEMRRIDLLVQTES